MNKQNLIKKIIQKKEFSELPKKDVELAFEKFDKKFYCREEKIKLTRDLLRKVFSGFTSRKILIQKNKSPDWVLKKHLSTRERMGINRLSKPGQTGEGISYYEEIYLRLFKGLDKKLSVVDLGAGVNGFSYNYFKKIGYDVNYVGVESIGQLVKLVNNYFENENISGKAIHLSLFELEKIKKIIKKTKRPKIVFLFKTIDSLEMLKRDYSKKLISEIVGLVDRVVVSFATRSMLKKKKFKVKRNWIINFIKDNFMVLDDFELCGERYLSFRKKART